MNRIALAVLAALTLTDCSDSRCNEQNCKTLVTQCRVELQGDANVAACTSFGTVPAGYDMFQFCPAACNETGSGELVQCFVDHPACGGTLDGGQDATIMACEKPSTATFDAACDKACNDARKTCEAPCKSTASFDACMHCAAKCGLDFIDCDKKCSK